MLLSFDKLIAEVTHIITPIIVQFGPAVMADSWETLKSIRFGVKIPCGLDSPLGPYIKVQPSNVVFFEVNLDILMSARADFKIHVIIIFKQAIAEKLVREGHHFIHFSIHGIFRTDNDSVADYSQKLLDLILLVN